MHKHRIAFICPSTAWGGLEMNVMRLAGWLTERGHHVVLYGNPCGLLFQRFKQQGLEVRPLVSSSKFGDIFLASALAKNLRQDNARIVILHMNKNFLLTALAKKLSLGYFKFLYLQQMHVGPSKKDIYHNWLYRQLDIWIAPLSVSKAAVIEKTNIPSEKIEVIPHGIDTEPFTLRKPDKSEARQKLGLPQDAFIVGVVGRLDPKKGQHVLIEACRRLRQKNHLLQVLFVGDASLNEQTGYPEYLEKLTREYGLTGDVHFRPHLSDVEVAFAAMDIFTLTSRSETYGMVTLEAMASGLPVIGTAEGGTVGIIEPDLNGLLVRPFDADELAAALLRLLEDRELAQRIGQRAAADAAGKYSYQHQCDLLENLFDRLLT